MTTLSAASLTLDEWLEQVVKVEALKHFVPDSYGMSRATLMRKMQENPECMARARESYDIERKALG